MSNLLTFTLKDLLLIVLWALVVIVLINCIRVLGKTIKILSSINGVVKANEKNINDTIKSVPEIAKNTENISSEIAKDIKAFSETVENISETSTKATAKLKEDSNVVSGVGSIIHTAAIGKALYDKYFSNHIEPVAENIKEVIKDVQNTINNK